LPCLGRSVTNPAFTGLAADLDPEFLDHLAGFIPTILSPQALTAKMAGGREVRCKDMVQYFRSFMQILSVSKHNLYELFIRKVFNEAVCNLAHFL
jgi:hypothetical protein